VESDEFEAFARQRLPSLVRFTAAMCADRGVAEDVVQEVLIRVHRRWAAVRQLEDPESYVRRALVNEYLSWRRKWARITPRAEAADTNLSAPDHAQRVSDRDELAVQLAQLPRRQRTAVVLRFYVGLSNEEIGEILGCRAVTVRGYVSRALAAMRVALGETVPTTRRER
jgi:RNA polymerase sigma-70 factor (sigma-E family)